MSKRFFQSSRSAEQQIGEMFNFVWPTAAALWNLRWQVRGFVQETPDASEEMLKNRFLAGSGIRGADLRSAYASRSWSDQQEQFASIVLINALAIYEAWSLDISREVGLPREAGSLFHRHGTGDLAMSVRLTAMATPLSGPLEAAYRAQLLRDKKYSLVKLDAMAAAYRYFKEIRNCIIHNGWTATNRAENAYSDFFPISGKSHLGMRGELEHHPIKTGHRVSLGLRGVVGFCDVLLRMIATFDVEFARTEGAERYLIEGLRRVPGQPSMLGAAVNRRDQQVRKRCLVAGFPAPEFVQPIYDLLRESRVIHA